MSEKKSLSISLLLGHTIFHRRLLFVSRYWCSGLTGAGTGAAGLVGISSPLLLTDDALEFRPLLPSPLFISLCICFAIFSSCSNCLAEIPFSAEFFCVASTSSNPPSSLLLPLAPISPPETGARLDVADSFLLLLLTELDFFSSTCSWTSHCYPAFAAS